MLKRFLGYVEITTKITSIFPFLLTVAYLLYIGQPIRWMPTTLFFFSMFLFDLTTTAINNYTDTKSNGQPLQFSRKTGKAIIFILLAISTILGLWLAWQTGVVVLLIGGICFLCGIFYTYGPVPISRLPLGELFSGIFYGLLILFLLLFINMPEGTYLTLGLSWQTVRLDLQVLPLATVLLLSIAPICTTADIMLANNICDVEKDVKVKRYTLPYYLGKNALYLFAGLYYLAYVPSVLLVVFKILHPLYLLSLLTLPFVQKNIAAFFKMQEKSSTFILSVKNYILIMAMDSLMIFICLAVEKVF